MKKILVMVLALAVMAPCALAQKGKKTTSTVKKIEAVPLSQLESVVHSKVELKAAGGVFHVLADFRRHVSTCEQERSSFILQSLATNMADAMDELLATKDTELIKRVCKEVNKPIKTGWGETIVISQYIVDHIDDVRGHWMSDEPINALYELNRVLVQYAGVPEKPLSAEAEELFGYIEVWRKYVGKMGEENVSHVFQQALSISEAFDEHQVQDKKELVRLAKILNEPVKTGWGETIVFSDYVAAQQETDIHWFDASLTNEVFLFGKYIGELAAN